jgi:hypothetical protein
LFCMIEHNPWNPVTQLVVERCPIDRHAELWAPSHAVALVRSAGLKVVETPVLPLLSATTVQLYRRDGTLSPEVGYGGGLPSLVAGRGGARLMPEPTIDPPTWLHYA